MTKRKSAIHVTLKAAMPIDLNQIDQLDAIGKAVIALRQAVADAGGEVIAVQHRVGTHKFAPAPVMEDKGDPEKEPEEYRDLPTAEMATGKRKAAS